MCVYAAVCVCVCAYVNVLNHKFNCKRMERVTRPQEFKTKVATNIKHAIKTTATTTATTTTTAVTGYQHIDINCRTYQPPTPSPGLRNGRLCGEKNDRKPDVSACLLCIQRIIQLTCRMCALLLLLLLLLTVLPAFLPAHSRYNFKDSCDLPPAFC